MNRIALPTVLYVMLAWLALPPTKLHAQSQGEMNRQAQKKFETADATLNKVYKELTATLDQEGLEKLKTAQRAWVQFRDAEAEFAADEEARGGSMSPLIFNTRRTELTEHRTQELRRVSKPASGG